MKDHELKPTGAMKKEWKDFTPMQKAFGEHYFGLLFAIVLAILMALLASSCLPYRLADRIEESHWALYSHTKALKVTAVKDNFVLLESFSNPLRTYELRCDTLAVGDTVILTDKIRCKLKIKKVKSWK